MLNLFTDKNNLDEVVFEHRNKAYGAYQIRKHYDERIVRSMMIVLGGFTLLGLSGFVFTPQKTKVVKEAVSKTTEEVVELIEVVMPETSNAGANTAASAATASATSENPVYQITPDHRTVTPLTTPTPTPQPMLSTPFAGASSGNSLPDPNKLGGAVGSGVAGTASTTEAPMTTFVEDMPKFNNGEGDLYAYLYKNIVYPDLALKMNISGKVVIRFDVSDKGEVYNVVVEKGIGYGCDEEAKRVVEGLPRWKPGRQNGKAVPVRMRLPISFTIQ